MRVFVAGATGAVGWPLVRRLLEHGHHVTAAARGRRSREALAAGGATPVLMDALDSAATIDAVSRARPDVVVNQLSSLPAALRPRKLRQQYARNDRVRRVGTENLLAAARLCGVARLVQQSIAFWYRPGPGLRSEKDPLDTQGPEPIATSVRSLAAVEERVLRDPHVQAVVLRYGFFYGPGTWYASTDGDIARQVRGRHYPIIGDGTGVYSFVHVADAAAAGVLAAEGAYRRGIYNVVDDEPAQMRDWLMSYANAVGGKPPRHVPRWLAVLMAGRGPVEWLTQLTGASNAKVKAEFQWSPMYRSWRDGFREGLS